MDHFKRHVTFCDANTIHKHSTVAFYTGKSGPTLDRFLMQGPVKTEKLFLVNFARVRLFPHESLLNKFFIFLNFLIDKYDKFISFEMLDVLTKWAPSPGG